MKPDEAHPLNLFRVHWYNGADRSEQDAVPGHVVLGKQLTGVDAKIVVAIGDRFPMIRAHKVLAAYACLAPRVVTGSSTPRPTGPYGLPLVITAGAGWPSRGPWAAGAWRCSPKG